VTLVDCVFAIAASICCPGGVRGTRSTTIVFFLTASLPLAGCQILVGLEDDYELRSDSDASDSALPPGDGGAADAPPVQLAACTDKPGYVCTLGAIPAGWALVAYASTRPAECPASYANSLDVVGDPTAAPLTCKCNCLGTPTCGVALRSYSGGVCSGTPLATLAGPTTVDDTTCHNATFTTSANATPFAHVDITPGLASACTSNRVVIGTPPIPAAGTSGRTCTSTDTSAPTACDTGVCIPATPVPYLTCITQLGDVVCPAGFARKTLVQRDGAPFKDERSCGVGSCGCIAQPGNCAATLGMMVLPNCDTDAGDGGSFFASSTSACTGVGGVAFPSRTYQSWKVAVHSGAGACVEDTSQPVQPVGTISLSEPRTLCCPG
jgi:hypothetical protein